MYLSRTPERKRSGFAVLISSSTSWWFAVVDDDLAVFHVRVDALVVVERDFFFELLVLLFRHVEVDVRLLVQLLIGDEVKFGDVLGIRVGLDGRDDLPALVIVPVGELVAGDDHFHPEVPEQVLVVVAPRAADNGKCGLSLADLPVLVEDRADPGSLPRDDLFGLLDEFRVAEAPARSGAATAFVDSMPMKLTFSHGVPYLVSIISAM